MHDLFVVGRILRILHEHCSGLLTVHRMPHYDHLSLLQPLCGRCCLFVVFANILDSMLQYCINIRDGGVVVLLIKVKEFDQNVLQVETGFDSFTTLWNNVQDKL